MKSCIFTAAVLAAAGPACAQDIALKPLIDARLRYETVDQAGLATEISDALTARLRGGLLASQPVKVRKTALSARFARYDASAFGTDTRKFWLQLDWVY